MSEEQVCRDALAILVDCVQLCKVVRGESEACTFNSTCADIFTGVVMQHLCSQEPSESLPARFLLPVIESELSGGDFKSRNRPPSADPSVQSVESDGDIFDRVQVLEMELARKDEELEAMKEDLNLMQRALARPVQTTPVHEPESPKVHVTASLTQHGVQVIPATELDLKFDGSKQSLGSGEYSDVYSTTRKVAVKAFKGRFNQQRFKEFKREAEALQTVQNSHGVVRLHGICIDALPNLYLVTEAVLGGSLEQLLASAKGKGLEAKRAVRIGKSIAEGMRDVHAKGVVHRDLKPSNCILTGYDKSTVKIIDFGLARVLHGDFLPETEQDMAGTPLYQAPEVMRGKSGVGVQVDVYSFGLIMWEMTTGEIPYEEYTLQDMRRAVVAGARPPIKGVQSLAWVQLMQECWRGEPEQRPRFESVAKQLTGMVGPDSPSAAVLPEGQGDSAIFVPPDMEEM